MSAGGTGDVSRTGYSSATGSQGTIALPFIEQEEESFVFDDRGRRYHLRTACCAGAWPGNCRSVAALALGKKVGCIGKRGMTNPLRPTVKIVGAALQPSRIGAPPLTPKLGGRSFLYAKFLNRFRWNNGGRDAHYTGLVNGGIAVITIIVIEARRQNSYSKWCANH